MSNRTTGEFKWLLQPISIGNMYLKNRIVMPPTVDGHSSIDGCPSKETIEYYARRARGGAAAVIVEAAYIDNKESQSLAGQMGIYSDRMIPWYSELADSIKMWGAKAVQQLFHAGRQTSPAIINGLTPVAPSALPTEDRKTGQRNTCRELRSNEIEEIIEAFGEAARRVKAAGFDAVELHGAHGYLLAQFLSPYTNRRTDQWGGSFENRVRFPLEVIKRVRAAVGEDYPIIYRVSGDEFVEGGLKIDEVVRFCKVIENYVDAIHVSSAMVSAPTFYNQSPFMYFPRAKNIHLAAEVKKAVKVPVIGVGAITRVDLAEEIIREGKADLVAMGRALIADPDLPSKVISGDTESIRPCIRCNEFCLGRLFEKKVVRCAVNPTVGREVEDTVYFVGRWQGPKKVLVAGGGPAGLEAAVRAASVGCEVILCEKDNRLGGLLNIASIPSFKEDIRFLKNYYEREVNKYGIEVRLSTEVTPQLVNDIKPEALIIAVGSEPMAPNIKGLETHNVVYAQDALCGNVECGRKVVIIGGGFVACDTALFLAQKGREVTVITRGPELAYNVNIVPRIPLQGLLFEHGVKAVTNSAVIEVGADYVVYFDNKFNMHRENADTIVIARGYRPLTKVADALEAAAPSGCRVYKVGDCVEVRNIGSAIRDAYDTVIWKMPHSLR